MASLSISMPSHLVGIISGYFDRTKPINFTLDAAISLMGTATERSIT
jgi:hypothetical protein